MEKIKIESETSYFAVKKAIFKAIEIFSRKNSADVVEIESSHNEGKGGKYELTIYRKTIKEYLGYDFRVKKARFKKEILWGGKLAHKTKIEILFYKILTDDLKENAK